MNALTDPGFWDDYWSDIEIPAEVTRLHSHHMRAILDVFDANVAGEEGRAALEIGGAPGMWGAYLSRHLGYEPHVLERSPVGCQLTRENFEVLGIEGVVHEGDAFDEDLDLPAFDLVYSLGLIEHFDDLVPLVERHLAFLKPGGTLIVGCPNFLGINGVFLKRLSPQLFSLHNLDAMRVEGWRGFETRFGLRRCMVGYVGGFEPIVFARTEHPERMVSRNVARAAELLGRALDKDVFAGLRRFNSPLWSGYAVGVYRKAGGDG